MIQPQAGQYSFLTSLVILLVTVGVITSCEIDPVIESTLVPDNALFSDQFDPVNSGNWHLESDDLGGSAIENNQMIIGVNAPNTIQYSTLREPVFDDFRLQVDLALLDGTEAVSYGVLFRMNDLNEFYRFEITGDGLFMVEKANADGSWLQYLANWKKADSIEIGKDVWNTLRVDAIGSELSFYVNNTLVYSMTDDALAVGNIGLDIGTFGQLSASAAFDNLIVQNP
ncbi:MAG: hypothetical protein BMS9Abin02_1730 [Anaerolineae bacterium]|nr:MAG: hypothetical protein BMS9Abin02_1730 [Anaerolineae bacterium]